jgi:tetratricopeptide (TPR) repeat protein
MKAVSANDLGEATKQLQAATAANPKFALAWHDLGILLDIQGKYPEAAAAYSQAIDANPKLLLPYVALTRVQIRQRDWAAVNKTVTTFLPLDKSIMFPEMFLHQSAANYNLKDLAAAEASARAALNPKAKQSANRAEYALGRILEAKGDIAGAKEHMTRYLELVPGASDADMIQAHVAKLGQAGAPEPELDTLSK